MALFGPQGLGLQLAQPIDQTTQKAKEQRFKRADDSRQQSHRGDQAAQTARSCPQKSAQGFGRDNRRLVRVRMDERFKKLEQNFFLVE